MSADLGFYDVVRVKASVTGEAASYAGQEGTVVGIDTSSRPYGYAVSLRGHDEVLVFDESQLESTGHRTDPSEIW